MVQLSAGATVCCSEQRREHNSGLRPPCSREGSVSEMRKVRRSYKRSAGNHRERESELDDKQGDVVMPRVNEGDSGKWLRQCPSFIELCGYEVRSEQGDPKFRFFGPAVLRILKLLKSPVRNKLVLPTQSDRKALHKFLIFRVQS